ncbi:acetyl-CoA carboxylase biotin carboxyl carrier protein subunit [Ramlibacter sp. WS9]|uniref:acetyl-CoA carboxylase biotin carboxyl carrier protein n=1 Tax=Ramlibacter sp. WS9 TaxID=1882741 RepID=UPI0011412EA0|nr:acetyl-CoA carboxylase biotin carboxyl carrier protein subunit [Ramlibacter sp. WS9]ROZ69644.1 acetyl-CoA carboxylase biotin carboxyl carrier protein subunit [Ramlibacter sp. WS9]
MELQQIKAFIDAMASSDVAEMEFSQDGWTLRLARGTGGTQVAAPRVAAARARPATTIAAAPREDAVRPGENLVRAPLYGVVHLQPTPGEPPFVAPGLAVKAGQTLCVIEAMKVFNEVRAEHDATVDAVLVASGQEVEAGQPLVRFA